MQYKCEVKVIDKKVFPDLQEKYLNDPPIGNLSVLSRRGYLSF